MMNQLATSRIFAARMLLVQRNGLRSFSGVACEPFERLRVALSEYRDANFPRAFPSRFKKEMLRPYIGNNDAVPIEQVNTLLKNIGHPQDMLSEQEQAELLEAVGSTNRSIPVNKMMELMD